MPAHAPRFTFPALRFLLALLLLAVIVPAPRAAAQEPTPTLIPATSATMRGAVPDECTAEIITASDKLYDYVILLDLSRSMVGWRGLEDPTYNPEYDIWKPVQDSAIKFIEELDDQASVYIVPFAGGVLSPGGTVIFPSADGQISPVDPFYLSEPEQRAAAIDLVRSLYPDFESTHIAQAMDYSTALLDLLEADDDKQHVQTLLLFTDGLGNGPGDIDDNGDLIPGGPSLEDILKTHLGEENLLFVKYIALSEAADNLDPDFVDRLIGLGVSFVTSGQVPTVREVRLALAQPASLGTLEMGAEGTIRLCGLPEQLDQPLRLTFRDDQSSLPPDVALKFLGPLNAPLGTDGLELSWQLVAGPDVPRDEEYVVHLDLALDGEDEIILAPARFSIPFRIASATSEVSVGEFAPIDARPSLVGVKDEDPVWRSAPIAFDPPLPEGTSVTLSVDDAAALAEWPNAEVGLARVDDPTALIEPSLTVEAGEKAFLAIRVPMADLLSGGQRVPVGVDILGEGVEVKTADGEVSISRDVEVNVFAEVAVETCDPGSAASGPDGSGTVTADVCFTASYQLGGDENGIRLSCPVGLGGLGSASLGLSIGERDGRDVFPKSSAGFGLEPGAYGEPAIQPTLVVDGATDRAWVQLDIPAEDLWTLPNGQPRPVQTYPVTIDVVIDPMDSPVEIAGAEANPDGTYRVASVCGVEILAQQSISVGPVPLTVSDPAEITVGALPGNSPVLWRFEVPYAVSGGAAGTLTVDTSELERRVGPVDVVVRSGQREETDGTADLDEDGVIVSVEIDAQVAGVEQLGPGVHDDLPVYLVVDPKGASVDAEGKIDNGNGEYAIPALLQTTVLDALQVQCDPLEFPAVELPDAGEAAALRWGAPLGCRVPEGVTVDLEVAVSPDSEVKGTVEFSGEGASGRRHRFPAGDNLVDVVVTADAADLRALGAGEHCIPVIVSMRPDPAATEIDIPGGSRSADGSYAVAAEACVTVVAAPRVDVGDPVFDSGPHNFYQDDNGEYRFRMEGTIEHREENGGRAVLTVEQGDLPEGLTVAFGNGQATVEIADNQPDPLMVVVEGPAAAALDENGAVRPMAFSLTIDPVESVLEPRSQAMVPAGFAAGGVRAFGLALQEMPTPAAGQGDEERRDIPVDPPPPPPPMCSVSEVRFDTDLVKVPTTGDGTAPAVFIAPVAATSSNGAKCRLVIDVTGELPGVEWGFGDPEGPLAPSIEIPDGVLETTAVIRVPHDVALAAGEGKYPITGEVRLETGEAFTIVGLAATTQPFELEVEVYTPLCVSCWVRNIGIGLAALLGLLVLWKALPGMPKDAVVDASGGTSPVGPGTFVGPGVVEVGTVGPVGEFRGAWFGKVNGNARFLPAQAVSVLGEAHEAGTAFTLTPGDTVQVDADGVEFTYDRRPDDGFEDGGAGFDGGGDGFGN